MMLLIAFLTFFIIIIIIAVIVYNKQKQGRRTEQFSQILQLSATQDKTTAQELSVTNLHIGTLKNAKDTTNFIKDDKAYFPYASIDEMHASAGDVQGVPVLDQKTNIPIGSSFTSKGAHFDGAFITNTTFDSSNSFDTIKSSHVKADTVIPKTLTATSLTASDISGDDSKFVNMGADLAMLKTLQADIVKPLSFQSDNIIIDGKLQANNATFNNITGSLSADILQGPQAYFDQVETSKGSFTNQLTTDKKLCAGDSCLTRDSLNKLMTQDPYPPHIFQGGTSTQNLELRPTEFPNDKNMNIIAGDTKIYGNTTSAGDMQVGTLAKFKNNNISIKESGNNIQFDVLDKRGTPSTAFTIASSKVESILPFFTNSLWSDDGISIYTQGKPYAQIDASGKLTIDKELCLNKNNALRCITADDIPLYREKKEKGPKGDKGDVGDFNTSIPIDNKTGINVYNIIQVDKSLNAPLFDKTTNNGDKCGLSHSSSDNALRLYSTSGPVSMAIQGDDIINISQNKEANINGSLTSPQVDVTHKICIGNTCVTESDLALIKTQL
jgi:hypothetical protein